MRLWLLRHAAVLVAPGTCYGVADVPADAEATRIAADTFAPVPAAGSEVWTSPASRAVHLAEALVGRRQDLASPRHDPRLLEMDFGTWELQPWREIPREAVDAWTADFADHRFGGSESAQEVIERVAQALDEALALDVPEMVWVTHAGVIRAVSFLAGPDAPADRRIRSAVQWPVEAPAMGGWTHIDL